MSAERLWTYSDHVSFFTDEETCTATVLDYWLKLRRDASAITFGSFVNRQGRDEMVPPSSPQLIPASGQLHQASSAEAAAIAAYLDSYALDTRIDVVDESGTPFVPFVRPMTPREFERTGYGILLSNVDRTLLIRDDHPTAANPRGGEPGWPYHDVFLVQLRPCPVEVIDQKPPASHHEPTSADGVAPAETPVEPPSRTPPVVLYIPGVVPLFRLRFRRGRPEHSENENDVVPTDVANPTLQYFLTGVFASGHRFGSVHDDVRALTARSTVLSYYNRLDASSSEALQQRQEAWEAWKHYTLGSMLADPRDAEHARRHGDRTCGYDIEGFDEFEEVNAAVLPDAPAASQVDFGEDFIPRMCRYGTDRMGSRVLLVERRGSMLQQWSDLCAELGLVLPDESTTESIVDYRAALRVVWKETRGANTIHLDTGELTAYLPADSDVRRLLVYKTPAEEQCRLWVQQALATCESTQTVHQVMLHVDLTLFVGRCAGLLALPSLAVLRHYGEAADEDPVPASVAAREHVIRILLETVENWVQGSGVIWRVVVMIDAPTREYPDAAIGSSTSWNAWDFANAELQRIQRLKSEEMEAPIAPSPARHACRKCKPRAMAESTIATLSPTRRAEIEASAATGTHVMSAAASPTADEAGTSIRNLLLMRPAAVAHRNAPPAEARIDELFQRLDTGKRGWLAKDLVKRVLLKSTEAFDDVMLTPRATYAPRRSQQSYLSPGTVLSPLDACGLPFDDHHAEKFVSRFCHQLGPDRMTYTEFACMMFDIARR